MMMMMKTEREMKKRKLIRSSKMGRENRKRLETTQNTIMEEQKDWKIE